MPVQTFLTEPLTVQCLFLITHGSQCCCAARVGTHWRLANHAAPLQTFKCTARSRSSVIFFFLRGLWVVERGEAMSRGDVAADVLPLALQEKDDLLFYASFASFHGVNISTMTGFKQGV